MALEEKLVFVKMRGSRKLPVLFAAATVTHFGKDPLVFQLIDLLETASNDAY